MATSEVLDHSPDEKTTVTERDAFFDSNDRLAIFLSPPLSSATYCRIQTNYGQDKVATKDVDSVADATATMKDIIAEMDADEDAPTPTPETTHLYAYPGYEAELSVAELFGNSTLGAFTNETQQTPIEEAGHWYKLTDEYDQWVAPIETDHDAGETVLTFISQRNGRWRQFWVRDGQDGPERIVYDTRFHNWDGPEPADFTTIVKYLGAYGILYDAIPTAEDGTSECELHVPIPDGDISGAALGVTHQPVEATPFADSYTHPYLEKTGHPLTVNGWTFTPDGYGFDTWRNADDSVRVSTKSNYVEVLLDDLTQDLSADHVVMPDDSPARRSDELLSRSEVRDLAVEWMQAHPADEFEHPLTRYVTAVTEHPLYTADGVSTRLKESNGKLQVRIDPGEDGPFTVPADRYCYHFIIEGNAPPSTDINPAHTTGFTTTLVDGDAPGAGNIDRTTITTGSLVDALDAAQNALQ